MSEIKRNPHKCETHYVRDCDLCNSVQHDIRITELERQVAMLREALKLASDRMDGFHPDSCRLWDDNGECSCGVRKDEQIVRATLSATADADAWMEQQIAEAKREASAETLREAIGNSERTGPRDHEELVVSKKYLECLLASIEDGEIYDAVFEAEVRGE